MNVLRLRDLFIAAPSQGATRVTTSPASLPRAAAPGAAVPADVAIVCAAEDARAIAIAAAAVLARRRRERCAIACVWAGSNDVVRREGSPAATRAARRLAAALAGRGLDAVGCGRAVTVALPADPQEALQAALRALAAAGSAPTVVALGGPRDGALDDLLRRQERVLVATRGGGEDGVAALAVAGLDGVAAATAVETLALRPATRVALGAGLGIPGSLRRRLTAGLERLAR